VMRTALALTGFAGLLDGLHGLNPALKRTILPQNAASTQKVEGRKRKQMGGWCQESGSIGSHRPEAVDGNLLLKTTSNRASTLRAATRGGSQIISTGIATVRRPRLQLRRENADDRAARQWHGDQGGIGEPQEQRDAVEGLEDRREHETSFAGAVAKCIRAGRT
jgi:hypothetical protein